MDNVLKLCTHNVEYYREHVKPYIFRAGNSNVYREYVTLFFLIIWSSNYLFFFLSEKYII